MYSLMCLAIILATSLTADVTVYNNDDYNGKPDALVESPFPWKFSYSISLIGINIYVKNKPPSVYMVSVTVDTGDKSFKAETYHGVQNHERANEERYFILWSKLENSATVNISLNFLSLNILCKTLVIAEGRRVPMMKNQTMDREFKSIHCKNGRCILMVDLENICEDPPSAINPQINTLSTNVSTSRDDNFDLTTKRNIAADAKDAVPTPSKNVVLIYAIPSVIVLCFIILVIYLSVKKYCNRNLQSSETLDVDTYVTTNKVVYADLSLVHGHRQQPIRDEESPYAEIIGVMKPADVNLAKK